MGIIMDGAATPAQIGAFRALAGGRDETRSWASRGREEDGGAAHRQEPRHCGTAATRGPSNLDIGCDRGGPRAGPGGQTGTVGTTLPARGRAGSAEVRIDAPIEGVSAASTSGGASCRARVPRARARRSDRARTRVGRRSTSWDAHQPCRDCRQVERAAHELPSCGRCLRRWRAPLGGPRIRLDEMSLCGPTK